MWNEVSLNLNKIIIKIERDEFAFEFEFKLINVSMYASLQTRSTAEA